MKKEKIGYKDLSGWLKILAVFVSVEVILTFTACAFIVLVGLGIF